MKNYRERLARYQAQQMTVDEAAAFEQELQDAASLFDYLMEQEELPELLEPEKSTTFSQEEKTVKQKIRRRFYRTMAVMLTLILLLVGASFWLVPTAIDAAYYNPMAGQQLDQKNNGYDHQPSQIELYQRVRSQINLWNDRFLHMYVTKTGPAKYEISEGYYNEFRGEYYPTRTTLEKGKIVDSSGMYTNTTRLIYGDNNGMLTRELFISDANQSGEQADDLQTKIDQLPESSWIKLGLTFKKPLTWQELNTFIEKYSEVTFYKAFLAINRNQDTIGVRLNYVPDSPANSFATVNYRAEFTKKIEADYPNLFRRDSVVNRSESEAEITEYLTSNLQYLLDHPEDDLTAYRDLTFNDSDSDDEPRYSEQKMMYELYTDSLASLEKNGLKFDKIEVALPKSAYDDFVTADNFYYVHLQDLSLFSNNL